MSTQTIDQIRSLRDEIRKSLRAIKVAHYKGQQFGPEQEYTAKGIKGGIDAILVDITAALKSENKFIQASTHSERNSFASQLSNINTQLKNRDLNSVCTYLDNIKPVLRGWGVRKSFDRQEVFEEHLDSLQKRAAALTEEIEAILEVKKEGLVLKSEIESTHADLGEKMSSLQEELDELNMLSDATLQKRTELESMLDQDEERTEQIENLLSEAKSHNEVIESFSEKVLERETQLEKQEQRTKKYITTLEQYESDHKEYNEEAESLIKSAKLALEYKTAEGLSAAFTEQFNRASKPNLIRGWIISSVVFVIASVLMGIWLVSDPNLGAGAMVGRVSLLPILIGGAWFSAAQYVKQKNIAEDYAYKSTLAKSIVGFSDQLSSEAGKGEEYSHYVRSVLMQIHNDPLRKHGLVSDEPTSRRTKEQSLSPELKDIRATLQKLESKLSKMDA
ncbi:hypothetical protein CWE12_12530 [Aliidiomarina sedimenti]|uniref:Chromosome partition protein Smc n=1 Tax=Aliidiomarina sedimenti TaxID=1933879 RepID=A0ABY0BV33_9GAMM|nr:hypothetical protein [Aliidiomarina sedimenti]RUO28045.1 hypothetical protein CWE12_12530 [Aliidiomarina sedimenti]